MAETIPTLVDAASTVTLEELIAIFRSEKNHQGGVLDDMLVAPLEHQVEVMADACRCGPFGFEPDFAIARYPEAAVPALIAGVRSGDVNSLTIEAYPDNDWVARHLDEARLPVIEFHMRNLTPAIMPRQRVIMSKSYVTPPLASFKLAPATRLLGEAFRSAFPDHLGASPDDFYRVQGQVFDGLPPQPRVVDVAATTRLRFTSTRPTVDLAERITYQFGFLSMAHVITSAPDMELLTPIEWLFSQLIVSRFDTEAFTNGEPLASITANYVLCGRRSRFAIGIVPVAAHAACGGGPSTNVLRRVA